MWSDNETEIDLLDFKHLVTAVTSIVKNPLLLPATIGVFGDWGSGKSSLIKMIQQDLNEDQGILCITFNGWLFEGYDDAKTALMGTILDEIRTRRTLGTKAAEIMKKLAKRVDWFRVASYVGKKAVTLAVGGPAALGLSMGHDFLANLDKLKDFDPEKLKDMVKEPTDDDHASLSQNIRDFRKDFEDLLKETEIHTLVVFIDDLDRCTPDTIIETLEAIRLFLFAPQTAFILGADERLVRYAVRRRFPELPGERAEVGRDYLEKLIQFPIRVTPLGRFELETYIGLLYGALHLSEEDFDKVRTRVVSQDGEHLHNIRFNYGVAQEVLGSVPADLEEGLVMAEALAPVLHGIMDGNPRQAKRFLNMLLMRVQMAESKKIPLKQRILAKLMVLEYLKPDWFRLLAQIQSEANGKPIEIGVLERIASPVSGVSKGNSTQSDDDGEDSKSERKDEKATAHEIDLLGPELKVWISNEWMKEWLASEPKLKEVDLRPYFYFSRDNLGVFSGAGKRLNPKAQEVLSELMSKSQAHRLRGIQSSTSLSPVDAAAVFEAVAERLLHEEDLGIEGSPLELLVGLVGVRTELGAQLITTLQSTPETKIPPKAIPQLIGLVGKKAVVAAVAEQLLLRWANSESNKPLKVAAQRGLKNLSK